MRVTGKRMTSPGAIAVAGIGLLLLTPVLPAQQNAADLLTQLREISIDQKLDSQVSLDLEFTDQDGKSVRLGDFFKPETPVVLSLVYYECPMLCTEILNGVLKTLRAMELSAGEEFQVVTVSIDPGESSELARRKKEFYLARYKRESAEQGWNFLTGSEEAISALAESVGFRYRYEPATDLYSHASGIMVLTPEGRVSRYQLGVEYSPRDLRLALIEASSGAIGGPVDQVLLYCFRYDPATGKYSLAIMRVLRVAALLTLLGIGLLLTLLFRKERLKSARIAAQEAGQGASIS